MVWDRVWERIALTLFSHRAWVLLRFASLLQLSGSCCLSVNQRWKPQVRQGQGPDPAPAAQLCISAASLLRWLLPRESSVGCGVPGAGGAEEFAGQREAPNRHTPTHEAGGAATPTRAAALAQDQTVSFCPRLPWTGHCRRAQGGLQPESFVRLQGQRPRRAGRELSTVTSATPHFAFGSAQALPAPSPAVFFRAFKSDSRWLPLMPGF